MDFRPTKDRSCSCGDPLSFPERLLRFAGHLLWPHACPLCGAIGVPACVSCLLPLLSPPLPLLFGPLSLEAGGIHEGILRDVVLELKYGGNRSLGVVMGRALGRIFPEPGGDLLVPVPLHQDSERDYNQSRALAEGIAAEWNFPVADILKWKNVRGAQTLLEESERKNMPSDALISSERKIAGKKIILVDDVATTGTTLLRSAAAIEMLGGRVVLAVTWTVAPKACNRDIR